MSADVEIRNCDATSLDIAKLIDHLGAEITRGSFDRTFIVEGTPDFPTVIADVDLGSATISFSGSYSSFSEHTFDIIVRIAEHVKGQIFVEGEPWSPMAEEHSLKKIPWWGWIGFVLFFPVFLIVALIALPFLLVYLIVRLLLIGRTKPQQEPRAR